MKMQIQAETCEELEQSAVRHGCRYMGAGQASQWTSWSKKKMPGAGSG